ncbi:MAG TPA: GNAT family N-acetyltransferase [Bacteroidia bacterium]|nr:GNAT family N-acetyltransferase [Bacteroidia bacterium]
MINIRKGTEQDIPAALDLIKELATYEKAPNEVEVSIDEMEKDFANKVFDFFVAELDNEIVGIALYYYKYSTWKGRCIYLDDIVVTEKHRKKGIGMALIKALIKVAKQEKVRKLEWQVLKWNTPAIEFYKKLNTLFDDEWLNCKLTFQQIQSFE